MHAYIALGNPGPQYEFTRHNFGWLVADQMEDRLRNITGRKNLPSCTIVSAVHAREEILICKPQTFMNKSGIAVDMLMRSYGLETAEITVLYDDIDIPFGQIKLRVGGGDGGHRGIRSILMETGEADFNRLRLGIKPESRPTDTAAYVLEPFSIAEEKELPGIIDRAVDALLQIPRSDIRLVMNHVNRT